MRAQLQLSGRHAVAPVGSQWDWSRTTQPSYQLSTVLTAYFWPIVCTTQIMKPSRRYKVKAYRLHQRFSTFFHVRTPWPITTALRTPKCQFIVYSHAIQIKYYEISFFRVPPKVRVLQAEKHRSRSITTYCPDIIFIKISEIWNR
jgi:hypothetical protein